MLRLRVKAPFAAFRTFTAGSYRPTAPFLTPSAAYGLLLNIAGIEMRFDDGRSRATLIAWDLPSARIAIGAISLPRTHVLYQQLHNYPVGVTGRERAADTFGNKYNIQPVRRELLGDLDAYVCLADNEALEAQVRRGLTEGCRFIPSGNRRYGMPFAGDNNLLISILREETGHPLPAFWFSIVGRDDVPSARLLSRMTVWIDRSDMSRTITRLFRRSEMPMVDVPAAAWVAIPPEAADP